MKPYVALFCVMILAGCFESERAPPPAETTGSPGPTASTEEVPTEANPAGWSLDTVLAITECEPSFTGSNCFEPAVAISGGGRAFAITGGGDRIIGTDDRGASFYNITPPPLPDGVGETYGAGDAMLHFDSLERMYFHALLYDHARAAPQILGGLQVARSDDFGATWKTNAFLSQESNIDPTPFASFVDRQWLATGTGDQVYLTFWSVGVGAFATHSSDAGATWSRFTPITLTPMREGVVSIVGTVAVAHDGSVLVPLFSGTSQASGDGGARQLVIAVSNDHGATWTNQVAFEGEGPIDAGSWPVLTVGTDGGWHVGWANRQNDIVTVSSADGKTWSQPLRWSVPELYSSMPPGLVAQGQDLTVTWYSSKGSQQPMTLNLARGAALGAEVDIERHDVVGNLSGTKRLTDFAQHALYPDGDIFLPWIDGTSGLFLGFERRG